MWLFNFDHIQIFVCMDNCQEDQAQHPLCWDEIQTHWNKLQFENDNVHKDSQVDISLLP